MLVKNKTFYLLFQILIIFISVGNISESYAFKSDTLAVEIKWEGIKVFQISDDHSVEYLTFGNSRYIGEPEGIEVFYHRFNLDVPHFYPQIEINNISVEIASEVEYVFLKSLGYFEQNFKEIYINESSRRKYALEYFIVPVRYNASLDVYEKLLSFDIISNYEYDSELKYVITHDYVANSVLSSGKWYKMCLNETGVYRLGYNDLLGLGINPGQIQKSAIAIYGNGGGMLPEANDATHFDDLEENAIFVSGSTGVFGENDYILFYGESPHTWEFDEINKLFIHQKNIYSDETCYFLTTTASSGKRIQPRESSSAPATHQITKFQDYAFHHNDLYNLIESGRVWYGELFDVTLSRTFNFNFPNIDNATKATITTDVAARSVTPSSFTVKSGSSQELINVSSIDATAVTSFYARDAIGNLNFFPASGSNLSVELIYNKSVVGGRGWLNYITVNLTRQMTFQSPQMGFRNVHNIGDGNVSTYTLSNANNQIVIWDITNPFDIVKQNYQLSGSQASYRVETDELKQFVAFNGSSFKTPILKGALANQNLHGLDVYDMIIVCHSEFVGEAQRLAAFRLENDGVTSVIVTTEQVYNEFSSGVPDIGAIRNFMKMFYDRATGPDDFPRYLLLFGNGTYDNKNILGYGGNLIPTFQTQQSLHYGLSWMTDDFFGLLDDSEGEGAAGMLDIGIGRLPVRTVEQAKNIVDKILRYNQRVEGWDPGTDDLHWVGKISNYADWRNMISLIADDQDNNIHFKDSEKLFAILTSQNPVYNVEKIYLDSYEQITMAGGSRYPDVNSAINNRINQGALLVNYIGHGGRLGLAHERILTFDDINTWNNYYNMPIFLTATCEFSPFDIPSSEDLSAGVKIFLRNQGGAVALYTTTRLAYSSDNFTLNERFFNNAFKPMENGQMPRLGDLLRLSKTAADKVKNFVLLGDPSMQMAYPKYNVITELVPDTIKAFQEVTITGYITDENGLLAENYNGVVFPKVYDKEKVYTTLGNAPGSIASLFNMQNSFIYKGKASVINGRFSFSFIVPKDIKYDYGLGKLSYYADNGVIDAKGFSKDFVIGGTSDDYVPDFKGPNILLFMNDTTFVSGDTTNENPILLGFLYDDSGINVTGNLGHDLVAFINNDRANSYILNQYYEADLDTYKSGKLVYPFFSIPEGEHTLTVRAWDVFNNFSEESIEFIVSNSAVMALYDILNYPNPFRLKTNFVFKHNIPSETLNVSIDIYNINGQIVKNLQVEVNSYGFQSPPIEWDGKDNAGRLIETGVYVYRLIIKTQEGQRVSGSSRLVIIR
jgi:hypothetical protein